ncbi:MAG: hypothetical protein Q8R07_01310, partial [Candidatus Uhrbacteria bacterium]|nr:hypothetical protein [Candidatus Uhrbacteria bacterium]
MVIYREDNHSDVATNRVTYTAGVRPKLETKFFLHAGLAPQDMAIELTTLFHVGFALYDTGHLLGGLHFQFEDRMPFRVVHGDFVIHFDFFLVRNYSLKDVFSAAVSMRMAEQ